MSSTRPSTNRPASASGRHLRSLLAALALGLAFSSAAPADQPAFSATVYSDAPDAIVNFAYNGTLSLRAQPIAVVDTGTDLGTVRVKMQPNDKGFWEGSTFLNHDGVYRVRFEGDDRVGGSHLTDDNAGQLYTFEVTSPSTRAHREASLQSTALKQIQLQQPQFRTADIFFNGRQSGDSRIAIVRSSDGQSAWRVAVANGGTRKVRILERVR